MSIPTPGVLGNDENSGGSPTTDALVSNPSHGTITFNSDVSFKYTPTIGFIGTDSFTYKDTNSVGTSNTATCTLTVQSLKSIAQAASMFIRIRKRHRPTNHLPAPAKTLLQKQFLAQCKARA